VPVGRRCGQDDISSAPDAQVQKLMIAGTGPPTKDGESRLHISGKTRQRPLEEVCVAASAGRDRAHGVEAGSADRRHEDNRRNGMHVLRHTDASVLLDAAESVNAPSLSLSHAGPGFPLRAYTPCCRRARTALAGPSTIRSAATARTGVRV
jgi:hypothetical protein